MVLKGRKNVRQLSIRLPISFPFCWHPSPSSVYPSGSYGHLLVLGLYLLCLLLHILLYEVVKLDGAQASDNDIHTRGEGKYY